MHASSAKGSKFPQNLTSPL